MFLNSYDPMIVGSLLTEAGEWTDVVGNTMIGRKNAYPFTTI